MKETVDDLPVCPVHFYPVEGDVFASCHGFVGMSEGF
jgi:hypothetical protein